MGFSLVIPIVFYFFCSFFVSLSWVSSLFRKVCSSVAKNRRVHCAVLIGDPRQLIHPTNSQGNLRSSGQFVNHLEIGKNSESTSLVALIQPSSVEQPIDHTWQGRLLYFLSTWLRLFEWQNYILSSLLDHHAGQTFLFSLLSNVDCV